MISAFGIDHTLSKSWKKLAPKLAAAEKGMRPEATGGPREMYRKLHYIKDRQDLGEAGSMQAVTRIKTRQAKNAYRKDLDTQLGKTKKKKVLP